MWEGLVARGALIAREEVGGQPVGREEAEEKRVEGKRVDSPGAEPLFGIGCPSAPTAWSWGRRKNQWKTVASGGRHELLIPIDKRVGKHPPPVLLLIPCGGSEKVLRDASRRPLFQSHSRAPAPSRCRQAGSKWHASFFVYVAPVSWKWQGPIDRREIPKGLACPAGWCGRGGTCGYHMERGDEQCHGATRRGTHDRQWCQ